jgi:iron complex transport system permease protein
LAVVLVRSLVPMQAVDWWLTPLVAFAGAIAAGFLVLGLARGSGGRLTVLGLVLAGLVINALCAALMSFVLARLDPFRLRVTTLWLAGGIGYASRPQLVLVGLLVCLSWSYLRARAHQLNAFLLGAEGAAGLGVDAPRLLWRATVVGSLLAALGVSLAGLLGYLGLIVPHGVRLLAGRDFRRTLALAALGGALLMVLADGTARLAFAPEELPAGVLTALLGCPVLLALLRAQLRGGR